MNNNFMKTIALATAALLYVFILPQNILAGGLKDKIQGRLQKGSNIQFNLDQSGYEGNQQTLYGGDQEMAIPRGPQVLNERVGGKTEEGEGIPTSVLSSYAIYQTDYKAELEENVVTVNGKVIFEVFSKGWTQLPLVRSSVGLIDVSINRSTAFVIMQGGKYYLMIDRPGRYTLNIEFLIKATREREGGPGNFSFEVMSAPISQYEFIMPETGVEIFIEPAIKVEVNKEKEKTLAWAVMPNTNSITTRWTKELPKEEIKQVKLEPKVYLETTTYSTIGEGLVRNQAQLKYSILQSEISNLRIAIPEDVTLLDVSGRDLRDWKVSVDKGVQYLDVYLNYGIKGNYILDILYERNIGEGSVVADIPSVKALGVERENGYVGVAAKTNVELAVNKLERVTAIDVKELPSSIWSQSSNPILLAFKYLNHPFAITIDVTKHEELPVLVAAIDSANYVTLYTEEGKVLTKATYQVRNNVKQFLHLVLPKGASLWSTFVAGKPVKPAKDKNGSILIPLEKSQLQGQSLTQFPVEIVYLDQGSRMKYFGSLKMGLPQTDIPASQLYWSVYFPVDYKYFNFGGDVKLTKDSTAWRPLSHVQGRLRSAADDIGEQFSISNVQQMTYSEKQSGGKVVGVLPIKIDIPQKGSQYRFSKLLVTEKESPYLTASYTRIFKHIGKILRIIIFIVILGFVLKLVKKIIHKK
ncbi:MAG: hypothetical protein ABIJ41_07985 [Candidatus Omnitrophota bacterium]